MWSSHSEDSESAVSRPPPRGCGHVGFQFAAQLPRLSNGSAGGLQLGVTPSTNGLYEPAGAVVVQRLCSIAWVCFAVLLELSLQQFVHHNRAHRTSAWLMQQPS
jgi:hypothetical protein